MSEQVKGFVLRLDTKQGNTRGRAWKVYNALIENLDGTEYGWVGFGFDAPSFKDGDYIEFQVEEKDGRRNAVKGTGSKPKNPPARANKTVATKASGTVASQDGFNRQTNPVDAERMSYSAARGHAIDVVKLLLDQKALPLTKATTGAGEAKRFEEITAAVDKLTVQYTRDSITGRLFDVVADAGEARVTTKADGPIPGAEEDFDVVGHSEGSSDDSGDQF
jgi:hypothetical protein